MKPLGQRSIILFSIIIGVFYSVSTDKWIFDHLRYKPPISFLEFTYQNLLFYSIIFLLAGGMIGVIFSWLYNSYILRWHIGCKFVAAFGFYYFFKICVVVGSEFYYWIAAFACRPSCGG